MPDSQNTHKTHSHTYKTMLKTFYAQQNALFDYGSDFSQL